MPVLAAGSALAWSALPFAAVRILVHQGHSRRELNDLKEREKVERTKHSSPFNTLKKTALSVKFFYRSIVFIFRLYSLILVGKRYARARPLKSSLSVTSVVGFCQTLDF